MTFVPEDNIIIETIYGKTYRGLFLEMKDEGVYIKNSMAYCSMIVQPIHVIPHFQILSIRNAQSKRNISSPIYEDEDTENTEDGIQFC